MLRTLFDFMTLFIIGSISGWILELFYRRIVHKKWINPGYLSGPWLPIYGFGIVILYLVSIFQVDIWVKITLIFIGMTLIEYIVGIFFLKVMHMKLWDYSKMWGNVQGVICPLFSIIWGALGAVFVYLLQTPLTDFINFIDKGNYFLFPIGFLTGAFTLDLIHSCNIGRMISSIAQKAHQVLNFQNFKNFIKDNDHRKGKFIIPIRYGTDLKEKITAFLHHFSSKDKKDKN